MLKETFVVVLLVFLFVSTKVSFTFANANYQPLLPSFDVRFLFLVLWRLRTMFPSRTGGSTSVIIKYG